MKVWKRALGFGVVDSNRVASKDFLSQNGLPRLVYVGVGFDGLVSASRPAGSGVERSVSRRKPFGCE